MKRIAPAFLLAFSLAATTRAADDPFRLKFTEGEVLRYRVEQTTAATESETDPETKKVISREFVTRLKLVKLWKVAAVDDKGIATLELSLESMRIEKKVADRETDVFDSENPDKDNREEMARLVGPKLATLRISAKGELVEVKESKFGPANRFQTDLPFKILAPEKSWSEGDAWERAFEIKLDPPAGTGETYAAKQFYKAKPVTNGFLTVSIKTEVKDPPKDPSDLIPLLPMHVEGDIYLDPATGRYRGTRCKFERTVENHRGPGSKYVYATILIEDLLAKK